MNAHGRMWETAVRGHILKTEIPTYITDSPHLHYFCLHFVIVGLTWFKMFLKTFLLLQIMAAGLRSSYRLVQHSQFVNITITMITTAAANAMVASMESCDAENYDQPMGALIRPSPAGRNWSRCWGWCTPPPQDDFIEECRFANSSSLP